jgi:hypothetical protein
MATLGLKGIWGIEQLDKIGIATWKLGLILIGTTPVVSYILTKLLSVMEPNPIFGPMSQQAITGLTFGVVFTNAVIVVMLLALARAIEVDDPSIPLRAGSLRCIQQNRVHIGSY